MSTGGGEKPPSETEMPPVLKIEDEGQEMGLTKTMGSVVEAEDDIPPSDIYSDFVAANPWLSWWLGLGMMMGFGLLGIVVSYAAKGGFVIGGSSVGFEARNSTLAGKIIPMQNIRNLECINDLSLVANGGGSKFHKDSFTEEGTSNGRYLEYTECYLNYSDDAGAGRRRLISGERLLAWGDYGEAYDPQVVSEGNSVAVALGSKPGISIIFGGSDLFNVDAIKSTCTVDNYIQTELGSTWTSELCINQDYTDGTKACLPSRTIGNYVTALANASSCDALTSADVASVKSLLQTCRPHYDSGALVGNCWDWDSGATGAYTSKAIKGSSFKECSLSADYECARYNAAYDIFFTMASSGWLAGGADDPLPYAQSVMVNEEVQSLLYGAWMDTVQDLIGDSYPGDATVVSASTQGNTRGEIFNSMLTAQMLLAVGVFVIVYFLILYHTGSFWITSCGFLQIFMAFFWGFTFYTVVLWREFFPFLNLVSLFLIIGIGADDLFVYVDAWKQSFAIIPSRTPLANRLSWTMRRAGSAMLVTTITTTASFFANIISPVTSLKGFGLFTGLVIFSDFLLMLIFVPATIAVHHTTFSVGAGRVQLEVPGKNPAWNRDGCSLCPLPGAGSVTGVEDSRVDEGKNNDKDVAMYSAEADVERPVLGGDDESKHGGSDKAKTVPATGAIGSDAGSTSALLPDEKLQDKKEETIFIVNKQPDSYSALGGGAHCDGSGRDDAEVRRTAEDCCCSNCCCCVTTCDIDFCGVPTEMVEDGSRVKQRWSEDIFEFYVGPLIVHPVLRYLFVGACLGLTIWLSTSAVQLSTPKTDYMQLLYEEHPIELYTKKYMKLFDIKNGVNFQRPYTFVYGIEPVDNGDPFNPYNRGHLLYRDFDLATPAAQTSMLQFCEDIADWSETPQDSLDMSTNVCTMYWFKQWMEYSCGSTRDAVDSSSSDSAGAYMPSRSTCCSYSDSDFPYPTDTLNTCIRDFANYWGTKEGYNHGLWFDRSGELKVMIITGDSTTKFDWGYDSTKDFYDTVSRFYSSYGAGMQSNVGDGWASTEITFFALQVAIADGAIESAFLSTLLAVIVLLLMTRRIFSSVLAAFEIMCVVVSVTGVFVILGWELNVTESIIFSLSVGLACDFAAHLAHSYNHVHYPDEDKVPLTFPRSLEELKLHLHMSYYRSVRGVTELGVTIALGCVTTLMAGVMLLQGTLYFFQQFGTFLSLLMAFSFTYALFLLMPLLATFGWIDRILAAKIIEAAKQWFPTWFADAEEKTDTLDADVRAGKTASALTVTEGATTEIAEMPTDTTPG